MKHRIYILILLLLSAILLLSSASDNVCYAETQIIDIPIVSDTYTYNGTQLTMLPDDFNAEIIEISGNTGTNAGNYTATLHLKDTVNYKWSDDTITDKTIVWQIEKANINFISESQITIATKYDYVIANFSFLNISDITVSYSLTADGEYTQTPLSPGNGTHTIYYKLTSDNYNTYYGNFTITLEKQNMLIILIIIFLVFGFLLFIFIIFVGLYYKKTGNIPFRKLIDKLNQKK